MNCPKCEDKLLTRVRVGELEVDHCDHCGGIWFDQDELPRLLELEQGDVRKLHRGSDRTRANSRRGRCPRCDSEMLRVASAIKRMVTVDKCADCAGVWLDGGEFAILFLEESP